MSEPFPNPVNNNNNTSEQQDVWVSPLVRAPAVASKVRKCSRCGLPGHNKNNKKQCMAAGTSHPTKTTT